MSFPIHRRIAFILILIATIYAVKEVKAQQSSSVDLYKSSFLSTFTYNRIVVLGTAPSCSSTGLGTGSCALDTGSTDSAGIINLTGSATGAALGVITLTFTSSLGTNNPICSVTLMNSTGTWNARASALVNTASNTAPTFNWDNNAVTLGAANIWKITYECIGK